MSYISFILMLSGALLWTGILCAVAAFAIHKLIMLGENE
jgi:hypothetical protein